MSKGVQPTFAFQRKNYILLLVGLAIIFTGYLLMSGGGSADPNVFDESIFSARRISVAPVVALIGYVVVGYAIMHKPKVAPSAKSSAHKS